MRLYARWWDTVVVTIILSLPLALCSPMRQKRAVSGPPCDDLDLVFLVDSTNSHSAADDDVIKTFVKDLASDVTVSQSATRVGLVKFSNAATVIGELDAFASKGDFDAAVDGMSHGNNAPMASLGVDTARDMFGKAGNRSDVNDVIILLTTTETDRALGSSYSWLFQVDRGLVITVGIGNDPMNLNLNATASTPDHFFSVSGVNGLDSTLRGQLATKLCEAAKEDKCAASPCQNGGVCTNLPGRYKCDCTPMFGGDSCEFLCGSADITIVMDASASIKQTNWDNSVVPFAHSLIDKLNIGKDDVRMAAIKYSLYCDIVYKLNTFYDRQSMKDAITNIDYANEYKGITNTTCGLRQARTEVFTGDEVADGDRDRAADITIVLTDGKANVNADEVIPQAQLLHQKTQWTYCMGITPKVRESEVNGIADDPSRVFYALDFAAMDSFIDKIKKGICERSSFPTQRCMDIDLAFVVDSSSTVSQADWDNTNQFIKDVLNHPVNIIGQQNTLVGRVDYSLNAGVVHYLDQYTDKQNLVNAQSSPLLQQLSFTHEGLKLAREGILNPANGERPNNLNMVTLITDGPSNRPLETQTEAAALRNVAEIFAIGVKNYDPYELIGICDGDTSKILVVPDFVDLPSAAYSFIDSLCVNQTSSPCDNLNQCSNGGTCLRSTSSTGFVCVCPPRFTGPTCGSSTRCTFMDVVFMLDESTSVKSANYDLMKDQLTANVKPHLIRPDYVQVGVVEYSSTATSTLELGAKPYGQDVKDGISSLTYAPSTDAFTNLALDKMRDTFTNAAHAPSRTNQPKVGFLITDSSSADPGLTQTAATTALNTGIDLYALGVGSDVDSAELAGITDDTAKVVLASDYSVIAPATEFLYNVLCGYSQPNACSPNPCKNGAPCYNYISGTAANPVSGYKCVCPTGYLGANCDKQICDLVDLTFVVEDTTVINNNEFSKLKEALKAATSSSVSTFSESNLRVVTFGSDKATDEISWTKFGNHHAKIDAISRQPSRYVKTLQTGMTYGIAGYQNAGSANNKDVMVVVYDQYTVYPSRITTVATQAANAGIEVYALAIDAIFPHAVMDIVGRTSTGRALMVNGFDEAIKGLPLLLKGVCGNPAYLNPCKTVSCNGRGYCVAGLNSYKCACDPGFGGQTCADTQCYKADLAYAIDSSASVGDSNWALLLNYVAQATRLLDIRAGGTQVAMVSYGWFHRMVFPLNQYTDHGDMENKVRATPFDRGLTMTGFGISDLTNIVFTTGHGARLSSKNIGIVITDGLSTKPTDTQNEAKIARDKQIELLAIGVKNYDTQELIGIVGGSQNSSQILLVEDFMYLTDPIAVDWIQEMACGLQRSGDPCKTNPCQNGGVCMQHVGSNKNTTYKCDCPSGFTGPNCGQQVIMTDCTKADVCILFDTTIISTQTEWDSLKHFVNSLGDLRNNGGNSVQVGVYGYDSSGVKVVKPLGPAGHISSTKSKPIQGTSVSNIGLMNAAKTSCHGSVGHRANVQYTTLLITSSTSSDLNAAKSKVADLKAFGSDIYIISTNDAAYAEAVSLTGSNENVVKLSSAAAIQYKAKTVSNMFCGLPPPDGKCSGTSLCMLVDSSASLNPQMYSKQCDFVTNVVNSQVVGYNDVQIGVQAFGYNVYQKINAGTGQDKNQVLSALADLRANQKRELTFIGKAVASARATCYAGSNPSNKKVLMIITDGKANDAAVAKTQVIEAHNEGIDVWAIGVGSAIDGAELRTYSSAADRFITVASYDLLVAQYSDIMALVCA